MANLGWKELINIPGEEFSHLAKGASVNIVTGCPNAKRDNTGKINGCSTPDGHSYCYYTSDCNRWKWNPGYEFHPDRLGILSKMKKPRIITMSSAGDMWGCLGERDTKSRVDTTLKILEKMDGTPHFYLFLSKFPQNYNIRVLSAKIRTINAYIGMGATITQKGEAVSRLHYLRTIKKYAPDIMTWAILEPIFFSAEEAAQLDFTGIDWIIAGALNHRNKDLERRWYPEPETVENIYIQSKRAGGALFFKDSLKEAWYPKRANGMPLDWTALREFPPQITSWAREARKK